MPAQQRAFADAETLLDAMISEGWCGAASSTTCEHTAAAAAVTTIALTTVDQASPLDEATILGFPELQVLNLSSQTLSGSVPFNIGRLTKLTAVNLSNCTLTGTLPPSLGNLPLLQSLDVSSNAMMGTLPNTLEKLRPTLTSLQLHDNQFTGRPPLYWNLANTVIDWTNNSR
jgi:hypothetical protein